jgi:aminoglycoside phosphotransferase (APT) family kinase protein
VTDLAPRLERFLAARMPEARALRVLALETQTEGFSQETLSFTVEAEEAARKHRSAWVLKREPVAGLLEPYDLEPEFRVLHALSHDPLPDDPEGQRLRRLPSPRTPWFERDPAVLDRPFYVMERLPGEVPIPAPGPNGEGPFDEAERAALAPQVMDALAALHAVDWRARGLGFLGEPARGSGGLARGAAEAEVERWSSRIARSGMAPAPVVAEALVWLRRNAPAESEVVLLHGDYRLGNWLVSRAGAATRLTGLLDWEMVHLGDPVEDVAWCVSHLWRAQTPRAACVAPPAELVAHYERASGRRVDPERLRYYEVLAIVKMIAIMLTGVRAFREGRTGDLRMAIFDHQLAFLHALLAALRGWLPLPG